ncbi:CAP domain-containing protein [Actinoplanes sp. NPDC051633]|uniref:CAP domain-containing protein n=1 Tax=Actinoplanes sp. NPDC051633 TaxID=3155670 RepID=UPI00341FA564
MSAAARFRYTMVAGATAVVIGAGFTVAGLRSHAAEGAGPSTPREVAAPFDAPVAPGPNGDLGLLPSDDESTPPTTAPTTAPTSATPKPKATSKAPNPKPKPKPKPKPTTAPPTSGSIVSQVLAHINAARADEGLNALRLDSNLSRAAALHNQKMINGCGLSHQCPGEKGLDRFGDQGVSFRTAGENIGFSSAGSSTSAQVRAANGLTDNMLAEKPPNDGHRKNLLNRSFTKVGLSVVRDSKGLVWFTQDFVG